MVSDKNEIRVYPCKTWEQFDAAVGNTQFSTDSDDKSLAFGREVIFRGHSNPEWKLWSTIERDLFREGAAIIEKKPMENWNLRMWNGLDWYDELCSRILMKFRKSVSGMSRMNGAKGDHEMWVLGRHYGLLSPYLDWTGSPYIAAFFAFEEVYRKFQIFGLPSNNKVQAQVVPVWGLRLWDGLVKQNEFEVIEAKIEHSTRHGAQLSWLTKLRSKDHIELEGYLMSRSIAYYLERYDLHPDMAVTALEHLDKMDINYLALFPDEFGAAWNANIDSHQFQVLAAIGKGIDQS